jgi:hypothetical protein
LNIIFWSISGHFVFTCSLCDEKEKSAANLLKHMSDHHGITLWRQTIHEQGSNSMAMETSQENKFPATSQIQSYLTNHLIHQASSSSDDLDLPGEESVESESESESSTCQSVEEQKIETTNSDECFVETEDALKLIQ